MNIYDYIIISPSIWIKIIYKSYEIHKNTDLKAPLEIWWLWFPLGTAFLYLELQFELEIYALAHKFACKPEFLK